MIIQSKYCRLMTGRCYSRRAKNSIDLATSNAFSHLDKT